VAEVAQLLGTPLMPWQRHVLDVALEIDPATGLLMYREVVLTVPRQSGKTLLLLCLMVHRALGFGSRQRILYTAQTRNDARKKWEDEHVRVLEESPFASMFSVRYNNGNEAIRWHNGSMHALVAPTEKAGHGETLDLPVIDEAFAQVDSRLEQAMKPAMITRPQPQLWVVSTAGNERSVYLRGKVDAGRARTSLGVTDAVAYFEWSASDDEDPADPATWTRCMPALGHTVPEQAIRAEFESMELPEFRRAFLNQWPDAFPIDAVIDAATWAALADPRSRAADPVAFAADMTPDRTFASIATAGRRKDGRLHVEVVENNRGSEWVVPRLLALVAKWKPCAVVVDGAGPAGSLIAPLEAAGVEVLKPSARDAAQACGQFYDAAVQGQLRHMDQPALNTALAGAKRRDLGDAWAWARKGASVDISPLVAATLAGFGYATRAHLQGNYRALDNIW
jgi:phage terminase large subunit-like protein